MAAYRQVWLTSPAGGLQKTGITSGVLRSAIEYGLPFTFFRLSFLCSYLFRCSEPTTGRCFSEMEFSNSEPLTIQNESQVMKTTSCCNTESCITAASYRITMTHAGPFPYFTMGLEIPPAKLSLPLGDSHLIHGSLVPSRVPIPKWHLDPFSHFCRAHGCDQQTHTHRLCYICSNTWIGHI